MTSAPPLLHRVARVEDEVHHQLLELSGVGEHAAFVERAQARQLDVGREQPLEHPLGPGHDVAQVHDPSLRSLLPGEEQ
jgi:hypothetical protein